MDLNWTPGGELAWGAVPSILGYNLYRGNSAVAPALLDGGADSCQRLSTTNPMSGPDVTEEPELGGLFIYLVTAFNGITEGPAGDGTYGPRQLDSAGDCGTACSHDVCQAGPSLSPVCGECIAQVCAQEPKCCTDAWDQECLLASDILCGTTCL
jgi:hypothetical protein